MRVLYLFFFLSIFTFFACGDARWNISQDLSYDYQGAEGEYVDEIQHDNAIASAPTAIILLDNDDGYFMLPNTNERDYFKYSKERDNVYTVTTIAENNIYHIEIVVLNRRDVVASYEGSPYWIGYSSR